MIEENLRDFGFARIAAATPTLRVADCDYNAEQIIDLVFKARDEKVDVVLFPELCVTGYTAADLFQHELLLEQSLEALAKIIKTSLKIDTLMVLGMPLTCDSQIFNCGVVLHRGKILGVVPKTYIPSNKEFQEKRWFSTSKSAHSKEIEVLGQEVLFGTDIIFEAENFRILKIGLEICEDLWVPIPQSSYQAIAGATLLLNLSASNGIVGKAEYRRLLVNQQSARCIASYVYSSAGTGESTTDVVFDGHAIIADNGDIIAESERFSQKNQLIVRDIDIQKLVFYRQQTTSFGDSISELDKKFRRVRFYLADELCSSLKRKINPLPFVPEDELKRDEVCEEIFSLQTSALAKRIGSGNIGKVLIGVSGGLDSTLALLVAARTFDMLGIDRKNIIALIMPGFGTTLRTKENSLKLCEVLGVTTEEIDIRALCLQEFKDIRHDPKNQNVVFENVQARTRTKILFDKGNQIRGFVLGTGDLSEIALGFCTYAGDHMSHYNVNAGVPKTLVRYLVRWVAEKQAIGEAQKILSDILSTPISPELLFKDGEQAFQKTEDIIGPYELHDFSLYYFDRWGMKPEKILFLAEIAFCGRYNGKEINKWLEIFIKRFFDNQWKRSCMPDGPKIGSVSLSPRSDWRMASDAEAGLWLSNLKKEEN